jgi:hypothetical protein
MSRKFRTDDQKAAPIPEIAVELLKNSGMLEMFQSAAIVTKLYRTARAVVWAHHTNSLYQFREAIARLEALIGRPDSEEDI